MADCVLVGVGRDEMRLKVIVEMIDDLRSSEPHSKVGMFLFWQTKMISLRIPDRAKVYIANEWKQYNAFFTLRRNMQKSSDLCTLVNASYCWILKRLWCVPFAPRLKQWQGTPALLFKVENHFWAVLKMETECSSTPSPFGLAICAGIEYKT